MNDIATQAVKVEQSRPGGWLFVHAGTHYLKLTPAQAWQICHEIANCLDAGQQS